MTNDLPFYVIFNSISVISDNRRMIMKGCMQCDLFMIEKILPRAGLKLGPLDQ